MEELNREEIEKILEKRKPGAVGNYRGYSVLIPLVDDGGSLNLLFEKRSSSLGRQPGEICFPGGEQERGETSRDCALRETVEELGVAYSDINLIGRTDTLYANSGFKMNCYVGMLDITDMHPSAQEVETTLQVPLKFFLDSEPEIYELEFEPVNEERFPYDKIGFPDGYRWRMPQSEIPIYRCGEHVIWGLTGRITHNFIRILKGEKNEI